MILKLVGLAVISNSVISNNTNNYDMKKKDIEILKHHSFKILLTHCWIKVVEADW